jgi:hypothetical protein
LEKLKPTKPISNIQEYINRQWFFANTTTPIKVRYKKYTAENSV